jgi:hypothetical protein
MWWNWWLHTDSNQENYIHHWMTYRCLPIWTYWRTQTLNTYQQARRRSWKTHQRGSTKELKTVGRQQFWFRTVDKRQAELPDCCKKKTNSQRSGSSTGDVQHRVIPRVGTETTMQQPCNIPESSSSIEHFIVPTEPFASSIQVPPSIFFLCKNTTTLFFHSHMTHELRNSTKKKKISAPLFFFPLSGSITTYN